MNRKKVIYGFWTKYENCFNEAKKYTLLKDFREKCPGGYKSALINNWINDFTWLKKMNIMTDELDSVYGYFFENENAVYIGRTLMYRQKIRDYEHRTLKNDTVYIFSSEKNVKIPEMKIIEENLLFNDGKNREEYWRQYYLNNGFIIINKHKCGSGGCLKTYTLDDAINESKKYKKISEFQKKSCWAYSFLKKKGKLNELTWLSNQQKFPKGYWKDKKNVIEKAKEYNSIKEFKKECNSAYQAALKNKYMNELHWLYDEKIKQPKFWNSYENCKNESLKYSSRNEFMRKSNGAYSSSVKHGWINDFTWIKSRVSVKHGFWNDFENCKTESLKYKTKTEFAKKNISAYRSAVRNKWINKFFNNE